jgi:hypothetical protein
MRLKIFLRGHNQSQSSPNNSLVYRLDDNLKPLDRPDGRLARQLDFLRGEWLSDDRAVAEILERDDKQVYDTKFDRTLG